MKVCFCSIAILMVAGTIFARTPTARLATVTVGYVDSFGTAISDCSVQSFRSWSGTKKTEYQKQFEMLVGKNIPFGEKYRVILKCGDGSRPGPFWVSVSRPDQFLLLSSWRHREDYFTGTAPRLTVSIMERSSGKLAKQMWVKAVGLYARDEEIDLVDRRSGSARFYNIQPGKFLLMVLSSGEVECLQPVKIVGPHAEVRLSLSDQGCKAGGLTEAEVD